MLTREENEMLTRVGPGTPGGELLRRYWFPVGMASELTAEHPTQVVRILGETLVLFRDKTGNVGLLHDRCPHRGASLSYGRVEARIKVPRDVRLKNVDLSIELETLSFYLAKGTR